MSAHLSDSPSENVTGADATQAAAAERLDAEQPKSKFGRHPKMALAACVAVGALVVFGIASSLHHTTKPDYILVSGRIEAPETHISAAAPARVKYVGAKEGDHVHKGQLLVSLDSRVVQTKINEASSFISQARTAQQQANKQVESAQTDITQAKAKSKGFFAKIFGSKKKKEEKTAQLRQEMTGAEMQLHQAQAAVVKAQAARSEAASKLSYFNITSPIDGICVTRSIEPGELAGPGQVLLVLSNPNSAYLKGFIAEGDVGKVKIGETASVFLDSNPKRPFSAKITSIDSKAAFTPENVYFKKDRVRQAFGMKIAIDHPDGYAKPGMPADAHIAMPDSERNK